MKPVIKLVYKENGQAIEWERSVNEFGGIIPIPGDLIHGKNRSFTVVRRSFRDTMDDSGLCAILELLPIPLSEMD